MALTNSLKKYFFKSAYITHPILIRAVHIPALRILNLNYLLFFLLPTVTIYRMYFELLQLQPHTYESGQFMAGGQGEEAEAGQAHEAQVERGLPMRPR